MTIPVLVLCVVNFFVGFYAAPYGPWAIAGAIFWFLISGIAVGLYNASREGLP